MHQAGINDPTKCLFVDDNLKNVKAATGVGWIRSVHFREHMPETIDARVTHTIKDGTPIINNLEQLRELWPDIFLQMEH
jgi:pyrimidine and pyridine-specific 5'-nucleotidase